jgi:hypothetical protein
VHELFGATWHVFAGGPGFCAVRRGGGLITWDGPASLILPCICAERLGDLVSQLCLQEFLWDGY